MSNKRSTAIFKAVPKRKQGRRAVRQVVRCHDWNEKADVLCFRVVAPDSFHSGWDVGSKYLVLGYNGGPVGITLQLVAKIPASQLPRDGRDDGDSGTVAADSD